MIDGIFCIWSEYCFNLWYPRGCITPLCFSYVEQHICLARCPRTAGLYFEAKYMLYIFTYSTGVAIKTMLIDSVQNGSYFYTAFEAVCNPRTSTHMRRYKGALSQRPIVLLSSNPSTSLSFRLSFPHPLCVFDSLCVCCASALIFLQGLEVSRVTLSLCKRFDEYRRMTRI